MNEILHQTVLQAIAVCKTFPSLEQNHAGSPSNPTSPLFILNQLNMTVYAGQTIAIVGASGSGKSTLLHTLGGLESCQEGTVLWSGQNIDQWDEKTLSQQRNQHLGFVYQFHHLLPEFNAQENVAMALRLGNVPKAKALQKASQILERLGLGSRQQHRPSELSGGERQRVALARALVTSPKLLLADEPTGNLDTMTAKHVFQAMLEQVEQLGMALVMVTHSLDLAKQCQQILHLKNGMLHKTTL